MASGRVGGTRSKIKGKVGDSVYQIVSDGKGGTEQIIYALPQDKELALTPALALQRCLMSICMRHMNLLTDFMSAAFEGVPEGTLSVQEFVRKNIAWMRENYDKDDVIADYRWFPMYGETIALPWPLIITEGTFQAFSGYNITSSSGANRGRVVGHFMDITHGWSLERYMRYSNFYKGEYLCVLFFSAGYANNPPTYQFVRFNYKDDLDLSANVDDIDWLNAFDVQGTFPITFRISELSEQNRFRCVWECDYMPQLKLLYAQTAIQFGMQNGKFRKSYSQMNTVSFDEIPDHPRYSWNDVYDSWYTDRL